jgi:hypothetical protein
MSTFVLIHGAGDVGWYWHLVEVGLRRRGHDAVAPDLPCDDDAAGLPEYADAVVEAIEDRTDLSWWAHAGAEPSEGADRAPRGIRCPGKREFRLTPCARDSSSRPSLSDVWDHVRWREPVLEVADAWKSKKYAQVEGGPVALSKRQAKIRRDGYRR